MQMKTAILPGLRWRGPIVSGFASAIVLALSPETAFAYMGPGLGLGAIGSALGVLAALLLALVSIVWYPAKRLLRRLRGEKAAKAKPRLPS